jgi:hypothetical protein
MEAKREYKEPENTNQDLRNANPQGRVRISKYSQRHKKRPRIRQKPNSYVI